MTKHSILCAVSLLSVTVAVGCTDRISGPDAARIADAVEQSMSPHAARRGVRFWDRLAGVQLTRLRELSDVVVDHDGKALTYRALVFESVREPPSALTCLGVRRTLILWHEARPDVFDRTVQLTGGLFPHELVIDSPFCDDGHRFTTIGPEPRLTVWWAVAGERRGMGTHGDAHISPGVLIGACSFLTPEAARFLRERERLTCELTRHRVQFRAIVRVPSHPESMPVSAFEPGTSLVELAPTEVVGIRITVHCGGSDALEDRCPQPRTRPAATDAAH